MVIVNVKTRNIGATATAGKTGMVSVTSATGGAFEIVSGVSPVGFNPLDTLFAAMAGCMVLSARTAAANLKVSDRFEGATVSVTGTKAHEGPSRIEHFDIVFRVHGDLTEDEKRAIMHAAEGEICTVSNTLRGDPSFSARLED